MDTFGRVLEVVDQLDGLADLQTFRRETSAALMRLISADSVLWTGIDLQAGSHVELDGRPCQSLSALLTKYAVDHPAVQSYLHAPQNLRPRRLTDVVPDRLWMSSDIFHDVFAPLGGRRQLSLVTSLSPPLQGDGYVLLRGRRDFSDGDVELASALLPALRVLHRNHLARAQVHHPEAGGAEHLRRQWGLTAREVQILQQLASGLTADAIARHEGISPRTVRKHLEHCYNKIGLHDRLTVVQLMRAYPSSEGLQ